METKKINLSEPTIFVLKDNFEIKVYPLSLEQIIDISPQLDKLGKLGDIKKQAEAFCDLVSQICGVDRAVLKKVLTLQAGVKIIQTAMGSNISNLPDFNG